MNKNNKIECPNCKHKIDVNDILYQQVSEALKKQYEDQAAEKEGFYKIQQENLEKQRQALADEKKQQDERVAQHLEAATKSLRVELKTQLEQENETRLLALTDELAEKSNQVKEFNKAKAEIERLKREKDELRDQVTLEKEQEFSWKLQEEKLKLKKQADDGAELKIKELQLKLEEQTRLAEEMKRKAEQGSMQLQGEAQELAIEEWLRKYFPLDGIEEIKKGARGADCLHTVHTHNRLNCGTIYYESKRTKDFQATWIEKFKNDIRDKNATLGVLVTEAMPNGMARMGLKEGVWVCTFEEFKGLCVVLRETVVKLSEATAGQENKGEKAQMLYDYLISNEFRLQIEGIVEGFSQMQQDLEKEKRAMMGIWKQREKQLEKVLLNTTQMHGSIRGIAGSVIQPVALLELDNILA
jgi:hypothetical protein